MGSTAAGDCGDDRYLRARRDLRGEPLEEPYVFVTDEHVDEATDLSGFLTDAITDTGMLTLEIGDHLSNGRRVDRHFCHATGRASERCRDANGDTHRLLSSSEENTSSAG